MSIETDWDSCPSEGRTLSLIFIPSLKGCDGYHFGFWFQDWVERIKDAGSSGLTFKRIKWCLRFLRLGQNNNGHLNTPPSSQFTLRIEFHLLSSWTVGMIRTAKNWELSILYIWSSGFYCRMILRGQKAMTQTAWDCFLMFFFLELVLRSLQSWSMYQAPVWRRYFNLRMNLLQQRLLVASSQGLPPPQLIIKQCLGPRLSHTLTLQLKQYERSSVHFSLPSQLTAEVVFDSLI